MKTSLRFKVRVLLALVLLAAMALVAAAMVRRSIDYTKRAQAAQSQMRLYRHSAERANSSALHHRIISESPKTEPAEAAHEEEEAEISTREKSFFDDQTARAALLRRSYERIASRPWESEPPSLEETRRRMLDAKHPSSP